VRIQHVFELLFRVAFEADEFHPEPVVPLPPDDGQRHNDGRPGSGGLDAQAQVVEFVSVPPPDRWSPVNVTA
jgi:hypothetical protein